MWEPPHHVLQIPPVLSNGPHCPSLLYLLLEAQAQASQH